MNTGETQEERDSSKETCPGKGSQVERRLLANKCFYPQHEITLLESLIYRKQGTLMFKGCLYQMKHSLILTDVPGETSMRHQ